MTVDLGAFDEQTRKNVMSWLDGDYDEETKEEIRSLLDDDPQAVTDAFYTSLTFGTGGLRGIMGVGSNRMNVYTVRAATQGLANYIKEQFPGEDGLSVIIGYDSRNNSDIFSMEAARVLAGNGIKVYRFSALRPTPLVSFGCRHKGCNAAIVITASHNPKEYNGYKVYWSDGGQIIAPHDKGIIEEVNKVTDLSMVKYADDGALVEDVDTDIDDAYVSAVEDLVIYPEDNKSHGKDLKVVYSSLHGTGVTLVPRLLEEWGFTGMIPVEEQNVPDGNFPTVESPNPEEQSALKLGIKKMIDNDADVLIATDPDADRVGVVVMHGGEPRFIDGNQLGCLFMYHVCEGLTSHDALPEDAAFIKSIVTTELFRTIAEAYGRPCFDVLCGFKYYAGKIHEWEQQNDGYRYIFGGEDSYGYLLGTHVRDKDAIIASAMVCEAVLHAKLQGKTLIDVLHDLYKMFGIHREKLESLKFPPTKEGMAQMKKVMATMRKATPTHFGDVAVTALEDYKTLTKTELATGKTEKIDLPQSDVLRFWLADGSRIVVRPSGTEPKVKLYCSVVMKDFDDLEEGVAACDMRCQKLIDTVKNLI
ncbi:MAG: phospho-sugar mutase [Waddliaceae bacterium]|nr:phospho-sugar mutase [Waddliaceae bacterium]MBT3578545.1 phospho-sugar mutase [Waddliaceae bacterium]MBT4444690.1 phospho-sugar mutase [Waddliaceae bacterium]MBT6928711.1 phospho-sugar mutase [Waddliaceae bacterium]MBT7264943.1 phospho-sugar mutase [Waddliaceae bacterium]